MKKEVRQGKGNVLRTMFREIEADCYLLVDGDDTYPAQFAKKMCEEILYKHADMVIGDRLSSTYFSENKRPFHNVGNVFVKKLINIFFNGNIKDILTGYRALSPLFVKSMPVLSKEFEIETEMNIHALDKNFIISNVPVDYRDRPDGSESKLNTVTDGIKVIRTIFSLFKNYKPLLCFSVLAFLLAVLSAGFGLPVIMDYFKTGLVERFPTFLTAIFFLLSALLCFSCGLILDTENKKARQNFETQLNISSCCFISRKKFNLTLDPYPLKYLVNILNERKIPYSPFIWPACFSFTKLVKLRLVLLRSTKASLALSVVKNIVLYHPATHLIPLSAYLTSHKIRRFNYIYNPRQLQQLLF
ncbi:hypothetical protein RV10_GL002263 [Enterococcus pallens]|nr:hypothetical protein RV10_GL002263 [Enterococcus pallens]